MLKRLLAATLLLTTTAAQAENFPDPVITVCPKRQADLDFAIYSTMTDGKFEQLGSPLSWRQRFDGPFHMPDFQFAQYLYVNFTTFQTSDGTKVIGKMRWRTDRYEFSVNGKPAADAFKAVFDDLVRQFPC